jgi:hypothetical protein
MKPLPSESRIVRSGTLLTAEVDGELIAMSVEHGECYGMNDVGTRIWELLAEPRSVASLCDSLVTEFDVDPALCREQVAAFIDKLRADKLVTVEAP